MPNPITNLLRYVRRQSPVLHVQITPMAESQGADTSWAATQYGEYYARSVPVYAAVKLRADACVRPPLYVYKRLANGERQQVPSNHPLQVLLDKANPHWTRSDLWRATSTYLDLWGSAYWIKSRNGQGGEPTELWPVRPDHMRPIPDAEKYIRGYVYSEHGRSQALLPEDVIWFRYFNPLEEWAGFSPVAAGRLSVDMGIDALKYNRNQFKNPLMVGNLAVTVEGTLGPAELKDFEDQLRKRYSGTDKAGLPLILGEGAKASTLGFSPREMEHIMTLKYSREDVGSVFGIPDIMLGGMKDSTFANYDTAERIFWRSIATYLQFLQEEVAEYLCPDFGTDLEVAFDLSHIEALQPNINELHTRLRDDVRFGILTPNEAREQMGYEQIDGGDVLYTPTSQSLPEFGSTEPAAPKMLPVLQVRAMRVITERTIKEWGDDHVKRVTHYERTWGAMQRDLFGKQKTDVLRKLRSQKSNNGAHYTKGGPLDPLFTPEEWLAAWQEAGRPVMTNALLHSARSAIAKFGLGVSFDVSNPLVLDFIKDRLTFWARRVNDETAKLLTDELQEAQTMGESIRDIQARVEKVFAFNDTVRSELIARTEMQIANNEGAMQAYRQSGVVAQKQWLATLDDRTRPEHADANGQTVPLEAAFIVGGESLMQPGDGTPENACNCRCTVVPLLGDSAAWLARPKNTGETVTKTVERDAAGFPIKVTEVRQ